MNRTLVAVVLALACSLAWSQAKKAEPAKPAATPPAAAAADKAPAGEKMAAKKSRRNEDARECLEKPSNVEIIKCAEAYL